MSRIRLAENQAGTGPGSGEAAALLRWLNQTTERLLDMVASLSCQRWNEPVRGFWGTIAQVTAHCVRTEATCVARLSGNPRLELVRCRLAAEESHQPSHMTPREMIAEVRHCRSFITNQVKRAAAMDGTGPAAPSLPILCEVLHQQIWHWSFHHGQISMLRQILGESGCR